VRFDNHLGRARKKAKLVCGCFFSGSLRFDQLAVQSVCLCMFRGLGSIYRSDSTNSLECLGDPVEQVAATRQLIWLLGGRPEGSISADEWWHADDTGHERQRQASHAAEAVFKNGGITAFLHVLRSQENEYAQGGARDLEITREIAMEAITRACVAQPKNKEIMRLRRTKFDHEGEGVILVMRLLREGGEGVKDRGAAVLAEVCDNYHPCRYEYIIHE
jgi:hypothetical protein